MASEDKTYCGRGDREDMESISRLAKKLGVSEQDILDVMDEIGDDIVKVEAYFKSKENSY